MTIDRTNPTATRRVEATALPLKGWTEEQLLARLDMVKQLRLKYEIELPRLRKSADYERRSNHARALRNKLMLIDAQLRADLRLANEEHELETEVRNRSIISNLNTIAALERGDDPDFKDWSLIK